MGLEKKPVVAQRPGIALFDEQVGECHLKLGMNMKLGLLDSYERPAPRSPRCKAATMTGRTCDIPTPTSDGRTTTPFRSSTRTSSSRRRAACSALSTSPQSVLRAATTSSDIAGHRLSRSPALTRLHTVDSPRREQDVVYHVLQRPYRLAVHFGHASEFQAVPRFETLHPVANARHERCALAMKCIPGAKTLGPSVGLLGERRTVVSRRDSSQRPDVDHSCKLRDEKLTDSDSKPTYRTAYLDQRLWNRLRVVDEPESQRSPPTWQRRLLAVDGQRRVPSLTAMPAATTRRFISVSSFSSGAPNTLSSTRRTSDAACSALAAPSMRTPVGPVRHRRQPRTQRPAAPEGGGSIPPPGEPTP